MGVYSRAKYHPSAVYSLENISYGPTTLLSFFNAEEIPAEHKNAELIIAILPLNRNIKTSKFTHELSPSQY